MPFNIITLGEFMDQLSIRLNDPANSFFRRDEVLAYTIETLRTWAAHTGYWIRQAEFLTTANQRDYDFTALAKYNPGSGNIFPIQYTVTDRELINALCYALLENPITSWAGGWNGTAQYNLEHVTEEAKLAVNGIQLALGLTGKLGSQAVAPTPIAQYDLPNDCCGIRTLFWQTPEGSQFPLSRQNQYLRGLIPDSAAIPDSYSTVGVIPRMVELSPIPTDTGQLVYTYAPVHEDLIPTTGATTLYLPTNFYWAAKWQALYNLLNAEGELRDKFRADYCLMRIKDAKALSKIFPGILRAYIDGVEVGVTAAWDGNSVEPSWRNQFSTPTEVLLHSFNILSVSPIATNTTANPTGEFSISFSLAANAPIPANEADYLDLGGELIEPLLAYAYHLACFKIGGQEFAESIPAYQRFLQLAMTYNAKLEAESENFQLLKRKSQFQRERKPVTSGEEDQ